MFAFNCIPAIVLVSGTSPLTRSPTGIVTSFPLSNTSINDLLTLSYLPLTTTLSNGRSTVPLEIVSPALFFSAIVTTYVEVSMLTAIECPVSTFNS